jgi:phosphonate transport system substrate-binding protein
VAGVDETLPAMKLAIPAPLGVERAKEDAKAIAALLTKALGRTVTVEVVSGGDIPKLLATAKVDLAFLSAMQYVEAFDLSKGKVAPAAKLVRGGLPFYRSVLFTRADQKALRTPRDLKGKQLAFVSEGSASGFQLPRLILLSAGFTELELRKHSSFLGDHAAVCKAVLDRRADAGATISNDRAGGAIAGCAETEPTRTAELRVIATSDPIPNDVIAVRPDLSPSSYQAVRNALIALDGTPEGKKALADVFAADAFVASDDEDFAMLRATLK